jgi:hypothetical protein
MVRKRKQELSEFQRETMIAKANLLLSEIIQRQTELNPNGDDYKSFCSFFAATKKLIIDLSGNPDYFENTGSGMYGLGSSRER